MQIFALSCFLRLHANKSSTTSVVRFINKWLFLAESLRVLFGQVWMQQSHSGVHQKRTTQAYRDLLEEVDSARLQTDSRTVRSWWERNQTQRTNEPSGIIIHNGKYVIKSSSECLILWVRILVIAVENRRAPLHIKMLWNELLFSTHYKNAVRTKAWFWLAVTALYIYIYSPATLLGTRVQLLGNTNCYPANHMAATTCGEDDLLKFKPRIRMGKKEDLSDFEREMVVGAVWAGRSISKTADLLRFYLRSLEFTENGPKKRKYPVSGSCLI